MLTLNAYGTVPYGTVPQVIYLATLSNFGVFGEVLVVMHVRYSGLCCVMVHYRIGTEYCTCIVLHDSCKD
jgi:hypothetical protein